MNVDFTTGNGLVPAIVQHARDGSVLMLGYMNEEALRKTVDTGLVTFFSRSRQRLWTKGEESGHRLLLEEIRQDCDRDALLVLAIPEGPTCHTGDMTCFGIGTAGGFLSHLDTVLRVRRRAGDLDSSYSATLFAKGTPAIAQKVGEEAAEVIIEAVSGGDERLLEESADLVFHLMMTLTSRDLQWQQVIEVLESRHTATAADSTAARRLWKRSSELP